MLLGVNEGGHNLHNLTMPLSLIFLSTFQVNWPVFARLLSHFFLVFKMVSGSKIPMQVLRERTNGSRNDV
jgi:hypothetical protein